MFATKHKPKFGRVQEFCLTFIVYTVFCKTFKGGAGGGVDGWQILLVFVFVTLLVAFFMGFSWLVLGCVYKKERALVIMGFYGCHHKTIALGLPLIKAIYGKNPKQGLYALPLLIWHPLQLVVGSAFAPRLAAWSKALESPPEEKEIEQKVSVEIVAEVADEKLAEQKSAEDKIPNV